MAAQKRKSIEARRGLLGDFLGSTSMLVALLASIALSIVSFFTTFEGMNNFFFQGDDPKMSWIMAFLSTFGVQILVFLFSWLVAYAIHNRRLASAAPMLLGYVVCAGCSIIFSYAALYDRFTTPQSRTETNARDARTLSDQALNLVGNVLKAEEERKHLALIQSAEYKEWMAQAQGVIDKALSSSQLIEKAMKARKEADNSTITELQTRVQNARSLGSDAAQAADIAKNDVGRLGPIVAALRDALQPMRVELEALQTQARNIEADMLKEEKEGGSKEVSKAGKGKRWREHKDNLEALRPGIYKKEQEVTGKETLLKTREAELDKARRALDKAIATQANSEKEMTVATPELTAARRRYTEIFKEDGSGVEGIARSYNEAIKKFEGERSLETLATARSACELLFEETRKSTVLDAAVKRASCQPQGVIQKLDEVKAVIDQRRAYVAKCISNRDGSSDRRLFKQVSEDVRGCVNQAALAPDQVIGGQFGTVRGIMDKFNQEEEARGEGLDAEARKRGQLAINFRTLSNGTLQAYGALALAMFIDLLVLLVAVAGRTMQTQQRVAARHSAPVFENLASFNLALSPRDGPELTALKRILSMLTLRSGTSDSVLDLTATGLAGDGNVKGFLNLLVADREARQVDEKGRLLCYVTPIGYRKLVDHYRELQSQKPSSGSIYTDASVITGASRGSDFRATVASAPPGGESGANAARPAGGTWKPKRESSFLTED